ncbi:DUF47 domain-containing protein [Luteipulveratus mongoliensis]|uniref:DUF47 family protein n=1 Tax=Luteipulveratus mongoliensis TaxID=571913 RepID=A0A0K1JK92_9MICO|nr:DUF47 family protein [Luteipulveratus mongoliensis]AKU17121.1 hypothetical protein VV02_16730 [Luteipulveratus mongoliensis]
MNRIKRLTSALSGRADDQLVQAVLHQVSTAREGAVLAKSMTAREIGRAKAHERMGAIEHEGDVRRGELVERLSYSITTPIDREDMFRLSRSVDDVLDTLRDFVREAHIYDITRMTRLLPLLDWLIEGLDNLGDAVRDIVDDPGRVVRSALDAKKQAGAICRAYQYEIAELFADDISAETFKRRELVRRLDIAGVRLSVAADALADGAMKRWH